MKKYVKQIIATTVVASLVVTGVHFALFNDSTARNNKDEYVTDEQGHTYAYADYDDDGKYVAVEGDDGQYYVAPIDDSGKIGEPVTDASGKKVAVGTSDFTPPTNTTAPQVSIDVSNSEQYTGSSVSSSAIETQPSSSTTAPTTSEPSTAAPDNSTTQPTTQPTTADQSGTSHLADQYRALFSGGTYLMEFTTNDPDMADTPVTAAFKNGNVLMQTTFMKMDCTILYRASEGEGYLLLDNYKKYCKLPEELMSTMGSLDGVIKENDFVEVSTSTVTIDGKNLLCEIYTAADGSQVKYYFNDTVLVRRDKVESNGTETCMYFTKIVSDVPDSTFDIPENYGYINLSWAGFLLK